MIDKIFSVVLVTFVITVTMVTAQNATFCDEEEAGAFVQNVRDCNGWFWCGPNGPVQGNCSPELNFNPITRACDWPANVECFRCPSNQNISTQIVDGTCRSFTRCVAGVPSQLICEPGLQFNRNTGQCDLETFAQCWLRFTCPTTLPTDGSIIATRDPFNCSIYHLCSGHPDPVRIECNGDLHFDPKTGLCTLPDLTNCAADPVDPEFRCPSDGFHPHPSSCSKYFICAGGIPHEFVCADGLHFNERTGNCDFPEQANCDREN